VLFRSAESLRTYLDAFVMDPTQPLSSLCLAKQLLFFCRHWLVLNRHETFVKAMACMMRYQQDRLQRFHEMTAANPTTEFDINEASIRQEILYNLGRGFEEVGLKHLAVELYEKVLFIADNTPELSTKLNLTNEAAYNLVLIYNSSNAQPLAIQIMQKYLSF